MEHRISHPLIPKLNLGIRKIVEHSCSPTWSWTTTKLDNHTITIDTHTQPWQKLFGWSVLNWFHDPL